MGLEWFGVHWSGFSFLYGYPELRNLAFLRHDIALINDLEMRLYILTAISVTECHLHNALEMYRPYQHHFSVSGMGMAHKMTQFHTLVKTTAKLRDPRHRQNSYRKPHRNYSADSKHGAEQNSYLNHIHSYLNHMQPTRSKPQA
jgi:hypothetical protein